MNLNFNLHTIMRRILLITALLFTLLNSSFAQKEEVQKALNTFLDTVQTHSYMRDKMDWKQIRKDAFEQTQHMIDTDSLLPIFKKIVAGLKDYHSDVELSKDKEDKYALIKLYATTTYEKQGLPPLAFSHKMIENKYAYIKLPGVMLEHRYYLDTIQSQIQELDNQNPEAWIIDLTENKGGAAFPMLVPFHDLIDTTKTFSYSYGNDSLGNEIIKGAFELPSNRMYVNTEEAAKILNLDSIQANHILNHRKPIIILTSNLTASSGEITTLHFKGQKNLTVVGTKTMGLTSGNELFPLSHGYNVNLMQAVLHDRTGKSYQLAEGITPDILIDLDIKHIKTQNELEAYIKDSKQLFIDKAIEVLENKN